MEKSFIECLKDNDLIWDETEQINDLTDFGDWNHDNLVLKNVTGIDVNKDLFIIYLL